MVLSQNYYSPPCTLMQDGPHQVMASASWGLPTTNQFAMDSLGRAVSGNVLPVGGGHPSVQRELYEERRVVLQDTVLVHKTERKDRMVLLVSVEKKKKMGPFPQQKSIF